MLYFARLSAAVLRPIQRFRASGWVAAILWIVVAGFSPPPLQAQTVFDQNGFGTGRGTYSALPYEHVDPLSGNLLVVSTDLVLPGNAGLDLVVQRVYNSAIYPNYADGGNTTLDEDSWAGIGWRLHFGRVLFESDNGSGKTQIEMGDGSRHALYTTTAQPAGWISKDFWVYNKLTHTLSLPNGRTYTFGHQVFIANLGLVRYVTEIRDIYGNTIEFSYFGAGGPPDGVAQIRQDLGQGQIRTVTFTYDPVLKALATMQFGDSVWTYTQTAQGPSGYSTLTAVQPPASAKPWLYGYETAPGFLGLTSMQAPSGGLVSYVYGNATRTAGPAAPYYTQLSRVVTSRSIGGPSNVNITPGTWTFTYNAGTNKDETIIDCPCGKTVYRYLGIGTASGANFASWRTGLLAERKVLGPADVVLEREVLTWQRGEAVSPDPVPATQGIWGDPDVANALLTQRVLERGPTSWTTTLAYRTGQSTYNDYGQAYQVTETGGGRTRTTQHTFWYGTPYIIGRLSSSTVTVGTEVSTASLTYDAATAAMTEQTINGITTTFDYYANGNPRTTWDAHNHATTIQAYAWGVPTEIRTLPLITYRQVAPSGLVTREEIGALQTNYSYDLAFRLTAVTPPGGANPTTYAYDGQWDGWTRVSRGSGETHTVVDGFGRPVSSVNQVQQKTRLRRDACGRVVFQALPYTNVAFADRGIETTYDVLGRVTKTRFTDGSSGGGPEVAETTYSYNGLHVTTTDPLGQTTTHEYAAIGGPGDAVLTAVVDAAGQRTTYTYDGSNRLKTVGGAMPARSWTYTAAGLLLQETQPESGTASYTYDAAGLLKTVTDAAGQTFTLTYDSLDRLVTRDGPGTASDATITYDALGRVATQQGAQVLTTYGYDAAGRPSLRRDLFQGQTYESLYGYDGNDNLTSLTYPSGRIVGYTYDVENRLTSVTQNSQPFAGTFQYDDSGALASYVTGAVTHRTEFDIRQRVTRIRAGAGTTPLDLTYGYNKGNQVTSIADPRFGPPQTFQYDALNRMTRARGPWGELAWTYDAAGNRLTEQHGAPMTFQYDAQQRLTAFNTATGGETYGYDALGRLTSDGRGTYTYTPAGMLATVTGTNVAASYTYDAEAARILRTVNGIGFYTLRGAGGQVLTEYEARCGTPTWTRDIVYAGARALGAIKAPNTQPTIALTTTASSVGESAGSVSVTVRLTTPAGTPTTCAASVSYRAVTHAGEAARGVDFGGVASTLAFPAGTASGATQTISVPVRTDTLYEPAERFSIDLTGATGAVLGAASHIVTITDDDAPPSITITDVTVEEPVDPSSPRQAVFRLTLSAASALQAEVNYITTAETARENLDYATTAGRVIFPPGTTTQDVAVAILHDSVAEQAETFCLDLSSPLHATLARTFGRGTILDNEPPRVPINTALPGQYFPDVTLTTDTSAYLLISNPHAVAVTARLTFVRPNASGVTRDVVIPAARRTTIDLAGDAATVGYDDVSLVVQTTNPTYPLIAEVASYWEQDWRGGRVSRGGSAPSSGWLFAEGATSSYFEEYLTVLNVSNEPVLITVALVTSTGGGTVSYFNYRLDEGPGRLKIRVNDLLSGVEHGTAISATTLTGAPASIIAERTMYWANGARNEGHSVIGYPGFAPTWSFAEGATGAYSMFLALMNPTIGPSNVTVRYLHENGSVYTQTATIPGGTRITLAPPPSVPSGGFAIQVSTTNNVNFVAERIMYSGPTWKIGDAALGAAALANRWHFAEGANSSFFDTWFLFGNPSATAATVTLTFRTDTGAVITSPLTIPANGRVSLDPSSVPGLGSAIYATTVQVTSGPPIVVERAMYWPTPAWYAVHVTLGRPE